MRSSQSAFLFGRDDGKMAPYLKGHDGPIFVRRSRRPFWPGASVLIAAALMVKFEAGGATPRNTSPTHRDGGEPLSKRRRYPLHPEIRSLEQENGSCAYECEQPCDTSCRSAFAFCTQGGTLDPICTSTNGSNATDTSAAGGWVNPINCTGGSLLCDVVLASLTPSLCNASSDVGGPLGSVILDTDSSSVQFALADQTFQLASVDLYLGRSPDLSGNDSFAMHSWYYPYVRQAIMPLSISWSIGPGTFLMAHASVCGGSTSTPTASPSSTGSPALALEPEPTLPRCAESPAAPSSSIQPTSSDVASAPSTSNPSPTPSIVTRRRRRRRRRRLQSLKVRNAMCPNQCRPGQLQACDSTCRSAWAYCNKTDTSTSPPTCVFHNRTNQSFQSSMTWTNPIPCFRSFECDLYLMIDEENRDCAVDESTGDVWIGTVRIDTDAGTCTFNVTASNYSISSGRSRSVASSAASGDPFVTNSTQSVWFEGLPKVAYLPLGVDGMVSGVFSFAAHALVCPDRTPDHFSEMSATIPTNSEAKSRSQIFQACPLFPRSTPTYGLYPSFGDASYPSQAPYTVAQLLASAVTEGVAVNISGLLGLSSPTTDGSSGSLSPTTARPGVPYQPPPFTPTPRSAPQTPQPGNPPPFTPTPRSAPQTPQPDNPTPFSTPETTSPMLPPPSPETPPALSPTPQPTRRPPILTNEPTIHCGCAHFPSPPPARRTRSPSFGPTFSCACETQAPTPEPTPRCGCGDWPSPWLCACETLTPNLNSSPTQSPHVSPKPSISPRPSFTPSPSVHQTFPFSFPPEPVASAMPSKSFAQPTAPSESTPISESLKPIRSTEPTKQLQQSPPSPNHHYIRSPPSGTPASTSFAEPTPASPTQTPAPFAVPASVASSSPIKTAISNPQSANDHVAPLASQPSDSPQAAPRDDTFSTLSPSRATTAGAEGDSKTRQIKETPHPDEALADCAVAQVFCGSASSCIQLYEWSSESAGRFSDTPESSEPIWWNEIGGSVLNCHLVVIPTGLTCDDCRVSDVAGVIGEAAFDRASGVFSAAFAWGKHLQSTSPLASSLPTVYFSHLDVQHARSQPNPNNQNPVFTEPAVEWTDVAIGMEKAEATGRFSLHIAMERAFLAHVSFCEA
jgi:hypothetical protein